MLDISAIATGNVEARVKRALLSVTSKLVYFVRRAYFFSVGSSRLGSKHVGEYIGAQCYNNSLHSTVHTVSVCMNVRASHFIMQTTPHALQVNEALCEKWRFSAECKYTI